MSIIFFLVAAAIVAIDQLTKHAIATHFQPDESHIVIPRVLYLTYVQNFHGAFGMFGSHPLVLAVAALAVVVMFYYWYRQDGATLLTHIAFGLILGGAIGNIMDRVRFHYVIDFIDLHTTIHDRFFYWPVFNVADSAISVGICLLLLRILVYERKPRLPVPAQPPAEQSPVEP